MTGDSAFLSDTKPAAPPGTPSKGSQMDAMAELSGPAATRTSGRGFGVSHNPYRSRRRGKAERRRYSERPHLRVPPRRRHLIVESVDQAANYGVSQSQDTVGRGWLQWVLHRMPGGARPRVAARSCNGCSDALRIDHTRAARKPL